MCIFGFRNGSGREDVSTVSSLRMLRNGIAPSGVWATEPGVVAATEAAVDMAAAAAEAAAVAAAAAAVAASAAAVAAAAAASDVDSTPAKSMRIVQG